MTKMASQIALFADWRSSVSPALPGRSDCPATPTPRLPNRPASSMLLLHLHDRRRLRAETPLLGRLQGGQSETGAEATRA